MNLIEKVIKLLIISLGRFTIKLVTREVTEGLGSPRTPITDAIKPMFKSQPTTSQMSDLK